MSDLTKYKIMYYAWIYGTRIAVMILYAGILLATAWIFSFILGDLSFIEALCFVSFGWAVGDGWNSMREVQEKNPLPKPW